MNNNRKTVLIADDDFDYRTQMKINLQTMGFDVIEKESQKEAEDFLIDEKPDLAIFDLIMENQDSGFILSYKVKQKYPQVPVIIATAVTAETGVRFTVETEEDKSWIKADLILEKGIRFDQLHREINKLMKL